MTTYRARLIDNGHMSFNLGEGVFDTLVNSVLWDYYFLDIPEMILKRYAPPNLSGTSRTSITNLKHSRKEITLSAMDNEPYKYLGYNPHFDGILRTRVHGQDCSYELALFEVSGNYGKNETKKSAKDRTKPIAGCRAMLFVSRNL